MNKNVCFFLFSLSLLGMAMLYGCSNAPETLGNQSAGKKAITLMHLPFLGLDIEHPTNQLSGPLGYLVTTQSSSADSSFVIANTPGKKVFYSFSHGAYAPTPGMFVGLVLNDGIFEPSQLPPNLDYDFVFLNACNSADGKGSAAAGTGCLGFIDRFNADVYMGWKPLEDNPVSEFGGTNANHAYIFAHIFFEELDESAGVFPKPSISQARDTTMYSNMTGDAKAWVIQYIKCYPSNPNITIDLI